MKKDLSSIKLFELGTKLRSTVQGYRLGLYKEATLVAPLSGVKEHIYAIKSLLKLGRLNEADLSMVALDLRLRD